MEIRIAKPEDAVLIQSLVLECYGRLASNQDFYHPECMSEQIRAGSIRIYLAVEDGEAVSMEACKEKAVFPKTLFMEAKMTRASYRGNGIAKMVLEKMLSDQADSGMHSFCAYTKGNTPGIQGMLENYGFHMTGFLFHDYRDGDSKNSNVVMIRNESVKDVGVLYAPEHLRPFIQNVYESLGAGFCLHRHAGLCSKKTLAHILDDTAHANTTLVVNRAGMDFETYLEDVVLKIGTCTLQTYQIFVNMKDESALYAYEILRERGFIFTGIRPLGDNAEYMIFYYSKVFPLEWESVILDEEQKSMRSWLMENSTREDTYQ